MTLKIYTGVRDEEIIDAAEQLRIHISKDRK
jgi:hypothetical protein